MRKKTLLVLGFLLINVLILFAKPVTIDVCKNVVQAKIRELGKTNYSIAKWEKNYLDKEFSYIVFYLKPIGYVVTTSDTKLPPILAYSFNSNFGGNDNPLKAMLQTDLTLRIKNLAVIPQSLIESRNEKWNNLFDSKDDRFEQWPPEGTTTTEGWLESRWRQGYPYNMYCPRDPVSGLRSLAGCPSIAVSQIINYYGNIYDVSFDDTDDYHHMYGGRNFWIDDDYDEHDFASFPELNTYLDSLNYHYIYDYSISNQDKGALVFATGVAATQIYSSDVSGTYYDSQVLDAYLKFNYSTTEILLPNAPDFYDIVSDEIKNAHPVHLSVVTEANDAGHQIVIDGYNTDDFYHLNMGWGGTSDGWYNIPDDIPYGLTVISCVFVNIFPDALPLGLILGSVHLDTPPSDETLQITISAENSRGIYSTSAIPNENGDADYVLSLPIGRYKVTASYNDYETISYEDVFIENNDMEYLDYDLCYMHTPQNLTISLDGTDAVLDWDFDAIRNFESFNIYRKIDEDYSLLANTGEIGYRDTPEVSIGDTIYYYVTAKYAQINESDSSNVAYYVCNVGANENEVSTVNLRLRNYPNPFNPTTTIEFYLQSNVQDVSVEIFNVKGQKIRKLEVVGSRLGSNQVVWNGKDENGKSVGSGVYFYNLKLDSKTSAIKKCILMK